MRHHRSPPAPRRSRSTASNNFVGAISVNDTGADDIFVNDSSGTILGGLDIGAGDFSVITTGTITQIAAFVQAAGAGEAAFITGGAAITLTNPANNFTGPVSVSNTGANDIAIVDVDAVVLGVVTQTANEAASLSVTAGGDISQAAGTSIVTGTGAVAFTSVAGKNITLDNNNNQFNGTVTFQPDGTGADKLANVSIRDGSQFTIQAGLAVTGRSERRGRRRDHRRGDDRHGWHVVVHHLQQQRLDHPRRGQHLCRRISLATNGTGNASITNVTGNLVITSAAVGGWISLQNTGARRRSRRRTSAGLQLAPGPATGKSRATAPLAITNTGAFTIGGTSSFTDHRQRRGHRAGWLAWAAAASFAGLSLVCGQWQRQRGHDGRGRQRGPRDGRTFGTSAVHGIGHDHGRFLGAGPHRRGHRARQAEIALHQVPPATSWSTTLSPVVAARSLSPRRRAASRACRRPRRSPRRRHGQQRAGIGGITVSGAAGVSLSGALVSTSSDNSTGAAGTAGAVTISSSGGRGRPVRWHQRRRLEQQQRRPVARAVMCRSPPGAATVNVGDIVSAGGERQPTRRAAAAAAA